MAYVKAVAVYFRRRPAPNRAGVIFSRRKESLMSSLTTLSRIRTRQRGKDARVSFGEILRSASIGSIA